MRLLPSLLLNRIGFLNSIDDRELNLQSLRINMIENLAVLEDQFDIIDFSHNQIRKMENFPKMLRLSILYFTNNGMSKIDSALSLQIPNIQTLELSDNEFETFLDVKPLSIFTKLEFLALSNNPVSRLSNYRLYMIHLLPSLRYLDYQKVTLTEKELTSKLFNSAAGKDLLDSIEQTLQKKKEEKEKPGKRMSFRDQMKAARAKKEAAQQMNAQSQGLGSNMDTSDDNNAASGGDVKQSTAKLVLTKEQKLQVRTAIANAKDQAEVDHIELQLQTGSFPFFYNEARAEEKEKEKAIVEEEKETVAEAVVETTESKSKGRQRRGSDVSVASETEKTAAQVDKEAAGKKRGRARSASNVSNATVESKTEDEVKEPEPKKKRGRARATSTTSTADSQQEEVVKEEPQKKGRKTRAASTTSESEAKEEPKKRGRKKKA